MQLTRLLFHSTLLTVAIQEAACQRTLPNDMRLEVLNIADAIRDPLSFVVLAVPVSNTKLHEVTLPKQGLADPRTVTEIKTSLRVLAVLKGPVLVGNIEYRSYQFGGYSLKIGPPEGASGPLGSTGLYFLRTGGDGTLRAFVDGYRPDIRTPWFREGHPPPSCDRPTLCVAEFLLNYQEAYEPTEFGSSLGDNVMFSMQTAGFMPTLTFLMRDAERSEQPVHSEACLALAVWFPLEFPRECEAATSIENALARQTRVGALRGELRRGRLDWVINHLDGTGPVQDYLHLLQAASDAEVRQLAATLLIEAGLQH